MLVGACGECIRAVIDYYKESIDHFIVVYDDISLDVGKLRVRPKGSAGGHNGIKNIIAQLGTDEFARVKFGVGDKPKGSDLVDHVLGRFSKDDEELAKSHFRTAAAAITCIMNEGCAEAMNRYNG